MAKLFVSAVHRVARLEGDHFVPAALSNLIADFSCCTERVREICLESSSGLRPEYLQKSGDSPDQ